MNDRKNPQLTQNSQRLRHEMTDEEKHLWYDFLKNIPVTVNRQKIISRYIVDFYCGKAKLVIEIDGRQHQEGEVFERDLARDSFLKAKGLYVLRISNQQIRQQFQNVCERIKQILILRGAIDEQTP